METFLYCVIAHLIRHLYEQHWHKQFIYNQLCCFSHYLYIFQWKHARWSGLYFSLLFAVMIHHSFSSGAFVSALQLFSALIKSSPLLSLNIHYEHWSYRQDNKRVVLKPVRAFSHSILEVGALSFFDWVFQENKFWRSCSKKYVIFPASALNTY